MSRWSGKDARGEVKESRVLGGEGSGGAPIRGRSTPISTSFPIAVEVVATLSAVLHYGHGQQRVAILFGGIGELHTGLDGHGGGAVV